MKPILPKKQYLNCGILNNPLFKVLLISFLSFFHNAFGQAIENKGKVEIYKDFDFKTQPAEIEENRFVEPKGVIPDMGWGKFKAWIKLNPKNLKGKKYLLIQNPIFEEIIIYNESSSDNQIIKPSTLLTDRRVNYRYPTFKIENSNAQPLIISGIASLNPAKFPIRLFDDAEFASFREREAIRNGIIIGILIVLVFLNIVIFGVFKLRAFGVFAFSATLFGLLYLFLEGYFFGQKFSKYLFENQHFNFHYLIYFGFQLSNLWIFSSVFQFEIRKTKMLFTLFRFLFMLGIVEGFLLFLSPMWSQNLSNSSIITIGLIIRVGAAILNFIILLILLRIRKHTQLAIWFIIALIPGWLVYLAPRFLPFLFYDFWFTMPQLYSVSMVWYIALISLGLVTKVYSTFESENANKKTSVENKPNTPSLSILLSKRETDILIAFTNGFSYTEISDAMFISPHTVRTHLKNIYAKIGVNSKAEAVRWVIENAQQSFTN